MMKYESPIANAIVMAPVTVTSETSVSENLCPNDMGDF